MKWGVIGLKYRPVSCDYVPAKEASDPQYPFQGVPPPAGASRPFPPRFASRSSTPAPANWQKNKEASQEDDAQSESYQIKINKAVLDAPQIVAFSGSSDGHVGIYGGSFDKNWKDDSWSVSDEKGIKGPSGGNVLCKIIEPRGAIAIKTDINAFEGKVSMEFWVKTDQGTPDININLEGPQGFCRFVRLLDINASGNLDGFTRYDVFLGNFDSEVIAFSSFTGCGGNGAAQINKIIFKNDLSAQSQEVCIDSLQLLED